MVFFLLERAIAKACGLDDATRLNNSQQLDLNDLGRTQLVCLYFLPQEHVQNKFEHDA